MAPESLVLPRSVALVGLMGAGKSCIGRRLASRLGLPFVDADVEIEAAAGCTISEIFTQYGEPAFRDGERRVVRRLLEGPLCILATGGGAFMDADTRKVISERAISVWLRADLDLLAKRTAGRDHRPLLKSGNPRDILKGLIDKRYGTYAQADVTVDSMDRPPEMMVDRVVRALSAFIEAPQPVPEPQ